MLSMQTYKKIKINSFFELKDYKHLSSSKSQLSRCSRRRHRRTHKYTNNQHTKGRIY